MFNKETTITRTYRGQALDFSVLSALLTLLSRFEESLPPEAKLEGKTKLLAVPRFKISTLSQEASIESPDEFKVFVTESSEPPEKIRIELQCHRDSAHVEPYSISPSFLLIEWSLTEITVHVSRVTSHLGLKYLKEIERDLRLGSINPDLPSVTLAPSFSSTLVERNYTASEINWVLLPDLLERFQSGLTPEDLREDNHLLLIIPKFEVATLSQRVEVETKEQFLTFVRSSKEKLTSCLILLACYWQQSSGMLLQSKPSFVCFEWTPEKVLVRICRLASERAISALDDFEAKLGLIPTCAPESPDSGKRQRSRTAFIAHSFDDAGRSYAFQLTKFLSLLGFEIATGEGFSPERVSTKVKRRLTAQEIVVVIVSARHDITWLTQEMTGASFAEKPLIVLVEEGAEFKPGILGDLEYIKFPSSQMGSTFIPIAEGLRELGFKLS